MQIKDKTRWAGPIGNGIHLEGFVMDLLDLLGNKTGAVFHLKLQDDGRYGAQDSETGEWSGMIGSVMTEQVDIAVADITQTALRETAVDFTVPFDQVGITILYPVSFGYIYPKTAWEAKPFQSVSELVNQVCAGPNPDCVLSALCLSE